MKLTLLVLATAAVALPELDERYPITTTDNAQCLENPTEEARLVKTYPPGTRVTLVCVHGAFHTHAPYVWFQTEDQCFIRSIDFNDPNAGARTGWC